MVAFRLWRTPSWPYRLFTWMTTDYLPVWLQTIYQYAYRLLTCMTSDYLPVWLLTIYLYDNGCFSDFDVLPSGPEALPLFLYTSRSKSLAQKLGMSVNGIRILWIQSLTINVNIILTVCKWNQISMNTESYNRCHYLDWELLSQRKISSVLPHPKRKFGCNAYSYGINLSEITLIIIRQLILRIYCTFLITLKKLMTALNSKKHLL